MNSVELRDQRAARRPIFIVTAPGLEELAAAEMAALGIAVSVDAGGLMCHATLEELYTANLWLRTASRVLVRVAEFRARSFFELERHAARVDWGAYLGAGRPVTFRVTSRKSRLYHQRAIEERLQRAIAAHGATVAAATLAAGEEIDEPEKEGQGEQLFVVRFLHDKCTISADASGALLHLRGYRQAVARAPLRETLAAALLAASGWDGSATLIDPLCGSGTIPIEAALIARRIAPGLSGAGREPRAYAFESWPDFDAPLWRTLLQRATAVILPTCPVTIRGSDRDTGAIAAARANAERAGVASDLQLEVAPVSALREMGEDAWLVTNPPYGVRVGESDGLRDLYAALGMAARKALPDGVIAMFSADRRLERQLQMPLREVGSTNNGGIPVRMVVGRVTSRGGRQG